MDRRFCKVQRNPNTESNFEDNNGRILIGLIPFIGDFQDGREFRHAEFGNCDETSAVGRDFAGLLYLVLDGSIPVKLRTGDGSQFLQSSQRHVGLSFAGSWKLVWQFVRSNEP